MHDIKVQKLSCPAYGKHISSSLKKDYFLLYPEWAFGSTGYFVFAGWGFRRAGCGSRIKKVVAGLENGVAPLPYDLEYFSGCYPELVMYNPVGVWVAALCNVELAAVLSCSATDKQPCCADVASSYLTCSP